MRPKAVHLASLEAHLVVAFLWETGERRAGKAREPFATCPAMRRDLVAVVVGAAISLWADSRALAVPVRIALSQGGRAQALVDRTIMCL